MLNDDLGDTVNVYTEVIQVETYAIHVRKQNTILTDRFHVLLEIF